MRRNVKATKSFGHSGEQLRLWDQLVVDPGHALKAAMSEAIRSCDRSREEIVELMNRLASLAGITNGTARAVTTAILDKWVAPGATAYHIPIRLLPIFCRVVGSNMPLQAYSAAFTGVRMITQEEFGILKWAQSEMEYRHARKRARRMAQEVGLE